MPPVHARGRGQPERGQDGEGGRPQEWCALPSSAATQGSEHEARHAQTSPSTPQAVLIATHAKGMAYLPFFIRFGSCPSQSAASIGAAVLACTDEAGLESSAIARL